MHELRFGANIGAEPTYLHYTPQPQPTRYYELQFGYGPSLKTRALKSEDYNLLLYSTNREHKVTPDYGTYEAAGVAFVIDIPYPDFEEATRYGAFRPGQYPYATGDGACVNDFNIRPRQLPRSNVFTYGIVNPDLPVVLQNENDDNDRRVLKPSPLQCDVKLYLYSGPPHLSPSMCSHLDAFNNMFRYKHKPLDLALSAARPSCPCRDSIVPPPGLTRDDLQHLSEIRDQKDMCLAQAQMQAQVPPGPALMGVNPAECVIGGGC